MDMSSFITHCFNSGLQSSCSCFLYNTLVSSASHHSNTPSHLNNQRNPSQALYTLRIKFSLIHGKQGPLGVRASSWSPASTPTISSLYIPTSHHADWPTVHSWICKYCFLPNSYLIQASLSFSSLKFSLRWWLSSVLLQQTINERLLLLLITLCFSHWTANYVRPGTIFPRIFFSA